MARSRVVTLGLVGALAVVLVAAALVGRPPLRTQPSPEAVDPPTAVAAIETTASLAPSPGASVEPALPTASSAAEPMPSPRPAPTGAPIPPAPAASQSPPALTPSVAGKVTPSARPGAMTVYAVTNNNPVDLDVEHVITSPSGFKHSFWSRVPAGKTVRFHLKDIPEIPSPFEGSLTLNADKPISAEIVGYDYR